MHHSLEKVTPIYKLIDFFSKESQVLLMDCLSIRNLKDVLERADMTIVNQSKFTLINLILLTVRKREKNIHNRAQ